LSGQFLQRSLFAAVDAILGAIVISKNKIGWQGQVLQKILESYEFFIHTMFQNVPLWVTKFNAISQLLSRQQHTQ